MIVAIFLSVFFAGAPHAKKNDEPLVSATNPTYLSCTFWTGKAWSKPAARSARTPVTRSPRGFLAYGAVKVEVQNDDCENTTTLYVAAGEGKEFRNVYKKDGGGNGIRIIGWSPDGDHLPAEVTLWTYESDTGFEYTPVIYDAATSTVQENLALEKATLARTARSSTTSHIGKRIGRVSSGSHLIKMSMDPTSTPAANGQSYCHTIFRPTHWSPSRPIRPNQTDTDTSTRRV